MACHRYLSMVFRGVSTLFLLCFFGCLWCFFGCLWCFYGVSMVFRGVLTVPLLFLALNVCLCLFLLFLLFLSILVGNKNCMECLCVVKSFCK